MTIIKTGLSYTATSLEDIATYLSVEAQKCRVHIINNLKTERLIHFNEGKIAALEEAAAILRATKLEPPECEGRTITGADLAESALKLKAAWDGAHISDNAFDRIAKAYTEQPSDNVGTSDHGYRANRKGACRDCGGLLQNHKTITCG